MLQVKLVRSPIGNTARNRATVRALGLRKMHQSVVLPDNPSVRGMIFQVKHMLAVEEVEGDKNGKAKTAPKRAKTGEGTKGAMRKVARKATRKAKAAARPAAKPVKKAKAKVKAQAKPKAATKPKAAAKPQAEKPKAAAKTKAESKPAKKETKAAKTTKAKPATKKEKK
jgi:ribosomal protein L30